MCLNRYTMATTGITHVFHAFTLARSLENFLKLGLSASSSNFLRNPANVNALKQKCVIVILAYFTLFRPANPLLKHYNIIVLLWISLSSKLSNAITGRHIVTAVRNVFDNKSIGEIISLVHNDFHNVMQIIQGSF